MVFVMHTDSGSTRFFSTFFLIQYMYINPKYVWTSFMVKHCVTRTPYGHLEMVYLILKMISFAQRKCLESWMSRATPCNLMSSNCVQLQLQVTSGSLSLNLRLFDSAEGFRAKLGKRPSVVKKIEQKGDAWTFN